VKSWREPFLPFLHRYSRVLFRVAEPVNLTHHLSPPSAFWFCPAFSDRGEEKPTFSSSFFSTVRSLPSWECTVVNLIPETSVMSLLFSYRKRGPLPVRQAPSTGVFFFQLYQFGFLFLEGFLSRSLFFPRKGNQNPRTPPLPHMRDPSVFSSVRIFTPLCWSGFCDPLRYESFFLFPDRWGSVTFL